MLTLVSVLGSLVGLATHTGVTVWWEAATHRANSGGSLMSHHATLLQIPQCW